MKQGAKDKVDVKVGSKLFNLVFIFDFVSCVLGFEKEIAAIDSG